MARIKKTRAMGIQMIRVSIALLEDIPITIAGATATAMIITAIRISQNQPREGRGWKFFIGLLKMLLFIMLTMIVSQRLSQPIKYVWSHVALERMRAHMVAIWNDLELFVSLYTSDDFTSVVHPD